MSTPPSDGKAPAAFTATPAPTEEEAAAIAAAIVTCETAGAATGLGDEAPRWRFSGRWWVKPVASRRDRP